MENSETRIEAELEQQNTGNHKPETGGTGGTRTGAQNVEKPQAGATKQLDEDLSVQGPAERAPERDEHGRL